ncbi:hypothetical protein E3N88_01020 [Mikania micrantha]|uniref:Uncharacterized protein n=1 Tax=Mikania micrantha TaxID=192012 RepID=A0A5N6PZU1_9ASTR|nr:hypothetical protein E3N88_01020 [Mikania micrantha]
MAQSATRKAAEAGRGLAGASPEAGQLGMVVAGSIGTDCSLDYTFNLMCNTSSEPLKRCTSGTESSSSGCFVQCNKAHDVPNGECSGYVLSFNECGFGFLVEEDGLKFSGVTDLWNDYRDFYHKSRSTMPVVLDWVIKLEGKCAHKPVALATLNPAFAIGNS